MRILPCLMAATLAIPSALFARQDEEAYQARTLPIRLMTIDGVWREGDKELFHEMSRKCVVAVDDDTRIDAPEYPYKLASCVREYMDLEHKPWLRVYPTDADGQRRREIPR